MIDIKLIREKADEVKAKIKKRNMDLDSVVDSIIEIDAKRREVIGKVEAMKAEQNAASKEIPQIKKAGGDASEIMAKMKELVAQIRKRTQSFRNSNKSKRSFFLACQTFQMTMLSQAIRNRMYL